VGDITSCGTCWMHRDKWDRDSDMVACMACLVDVVVFGRNMVEGFCSETCLARGLVS
jgi:hypothetical protein